MTGSILDLRARGSLLMIQLAQLHRHPGIYERPTELLSSERGCK